MRRTAFFLAVLMVILLLPGGCGGGLEGEVIDLLERRSGELKSISYVCVTEDAERLYREEFELRFPDAYRYRFYEYSDGQPQLLNYTMQSGTDIWRARVVQGAEAETPSLQVEQLASIPPLRCTGTYLSLYHLIGNADYFQSMIALLDSGELRAAGTEDLDGTVAYRLESASGLTPRMRIWLNAESGLPVRKELALGEDRVVVFRYEDVVENPPYEEGPFPPDALDLFGDSAAGADPLAKDGACRPVDIAAASAQAGFVPLVPELPGFELAASYVRDPAASDLAASEESAQFPEGFREIYLVLRDGARQVEIRQSPYDPEFSYYTTGMSSLSGAYLTSQKTFGEDAGGAAYSAAIDCQEMRLTLGDIDLMVTGDLSREEFESLAVQLEDLSGSSP